MEEGEMVCLKMAGRGRPPSHEALKMLEGAIYVCLRFSFQDQQHVLAIVRWTHVSDLTQNYQPYSSGHVKPQTREKMLTDIT